MKAVLHQIFKSYGPTQVLDNLSLTLEGVTVLMAPSGQGKTTLARLLLGLEQPDSGRMEITGHLVAQFQEDRLCEHLTAVENICLVLGKSGKNRAEQALKQLGLEEQALKKPVCQLSGGQRRRVSLVRAMLADAEGVILDEPFKGLDADSRAMALEWVKQQIQGRWILLITHDKTEAEALGGTLLEW